MPEHNGVQLNLKVPVDFPQDREDNDTFNYPTNYQGLTRGEVDDACAPAKFFEEKKNGKLRELSPEHLRFVSMYLQGWKGPQIAKHFNRSVNHVYRVLADPLSKQLVAEFNEAYKDEFQQMIPLVADAVREGLEHPNPQIRLKSVDRFIKVSNYFEGNDEENKGSKVEAIYQARARFVDMVKSAAKTIEGTGGEIELEATMVESST